MPASTNLRILNWLNPGAMEQRILPDLPLFPVMDQWVLGEPDKGDPQPLIPLSSRLFSLSTCD